MTLMVTMIAFIALSGWWVRTVLFDEDLYVRAVEPLAGSPAFARMSAGFAARNIGRRSVLGRRPGRTTDRLVRAATTTTMSTRAFVHSWPMLQRSLHRHRRVVTGSARRQLRLGVAMVFLATMGNCVRAASWLGFDLAVGRRGRLRGSCRLRGCRRPDHS